ncbi:unknown protein (plasmid) [Synechocystis sp. PCC 6803]|uniref:CRISPR type III-associated protein domain-containing protein n=1 Tax=Synechocystis sp. (strain ATCC 27184 / PCC 6803 / Kazusa) TaxID=1111708 RepID=Q6ZEB3_SYNY3|nr:MULTISPECIES: RAMP superfamily CRISPR-associated protein [unclassified Synechocystis]MBD2618884.1 hypothetical protein [Synechocystis sp. FACHB-898]MBD2637375.1 hypothetical protein [Synechocystis sp. FACHB-908]MBD2661606.1 hypothetical protein [Synechocystis sp. FACHB-929]AGF53639.1 hypothetical protein MYO_4830 [Synechocystis sp. PCC 6803]AVP91488.1 hypothetical protein C7I86_17100 [Synechocystis sp. IPPAS B-1465]
MEYLRWMRPADHQYKDATKVQILQKAMENAKNYDARLSVCNQRTKAIAKETFEVTCPWRIRVGGHRGPESILLPAFDALGMPYIPSATLRGVARTQAIREVMQNTGKNWKDAEKDSLIVKHFGALDADKADQAGKVVFLDAYPTSGKCLAVDMANNIWSWEGNHLDYSPNPNPFLSLKEPTFLIGLRLISNCSDQQVLTQVKKWLINGLANGAGSQINTGYGQLLENPKKLLSKPFLEVEFALEGQLIHGYQKPGEWSWNNNKNEWQMRGSNQAEVRPTAFKSMLRYWFRVFALGVMPPKNTKVLEAKIFGSLDPQSMGIIKVTVLEKEPENENEQSGTLRLFFTSEVDENQKDNLQNLFSNLIWLMFYLGGIGQGARRPCYYRKGNPKIRGSSFFVQNPSEFSSIPGNIDEFRLRILGKITQLIDLLSLLKTTFNFTERSNNFNHSSHQWTECADLNMRIFVVPNANQDNAKSYALSKLNQKFHQLDDQIKSLKKEKNFPELKRVYSELKSLCGGVQKDKILVNGQQKERKVLPSPIWVRSLGPFDVVTIFGATASPRSDYLRSLQGAIQIFPLS